MAQRAIEQLRIVDLDPLSSLLWAQACCVVPRCSSEIHIILAALLYTLRLVLDGP